MESRDPDPGDVNGGFFFLFSGVVKPLWWHDARYAAFQETLQSQSNHRPKNHGLNWGMVFYIEGCRACPRILHAMPKSHERTS